MSEFQLYLKLGISHIADFQSYDHFLFIIVLFVTYPLKYWGRILILLTAAILGHFLAIGANALDIHFFKPEIIGFIIPAILFLTGSANLQQKSDNFIPFLFKFKYFLATAFGFFHGINFSAYITGAAVKEGSNIMPMLGYNLGIESAELAILLAFIALTLIVVDLSGVKRREWILIWSGAAMGVSAVMMINSFPW